MGNEEINIEVVYPLSDEQVLISLTVASPISVEQAIRQSGLLQRYPDIDLQRNKIGVFGKLVKLTDLLNTGDRVEIYRPLLQHPMEARRKRATR